MIQLLVALTMVGLGGYGLARPAVFSKLPERRARALSGVILGIGILMILLQVVLFSAA
ncbi:MAG: hypothetical protein L0H84_06450 [Pseudonocardia sp.]|nr:hypothetical protein [Pseudonocardia sp.]